MQMLVSGISEKNGERIAYIRFEEDDCYAEGVIPSCKILKQSGFSEAEIADLELYMRQNLGMLKREAAQIDPIRGLMND